MSKLDWSNLSEDSTSRILIQLNQAKQPEDILGKKSHHDITPQGLPTVKNDSPLNLETAQDIITFRNQLTGGVFSQIQELAQIDWFTQEMLDALVEILEERNGSFTEGEIIDRKEYFETFIDLYTPGFHTGRIDLNLDGPDQISRISGISIEEAKKVITLRETVDTINLASLARFLSLESLRPCLGQRIC